MKVYKVTVLAYGFENVDSDSIREQIRNMRHLSADVVSIEEAEIGRWHDNHPLNKNHTHRAEFDRLFPTKSTD